MTHWNHPGWFAYFPCNNSPPSILAEMLTSAIGAQCMSWATSPAATELEQVVMDWLRQMIGLPPEFVGVIQDTASTATLVALLSARERATGGAAGARGTRAADRARGLCLRRGAFLGGQGGEARRVRARAAPPDRRPTADFALRPEVLERALAEDVGAGIRPACVIASVGTTSSTAIDPVPAIAEICGRHGVWLHVDAAYAGPAAIVPELRWILDGVDRADSVVLNPHKWLLTNFDCTAYYVRDPAALLGAFQASPEYLRTAYDPEVVNFRDWGIQLGRRFRALKLWFVLRSYGVEGLQAMIRGHVALARELEGWIRQEPGFRGDGAGAARPGVLSLPPRGTRASPRWMTSTAACWSG